MQAGFYIYQRRCSIKNFYITRSKNRHRMAITILLLLLLMVYECWAISCSTVAKTVKVADLIDLFNLGAIIAASGLASATRHATRHATGHATFTASVELLHDGVADAFELLLLLFVFLLFG